MARNPERPRIDFKRASPKIQVEDLDFFICAARHNIIFAKQIPILFRGTDFFKKHLTK